MRKARIAVIHLLRETTLSVDKIAEYVEVPLNFVEKIKAELKKNPDLL